MATVFPHFYISLILENTLFESTCVVPIFDAPLPRSFSTLSIHFKNCRKICKTLDYGIHVEMSVGAQEIKLHEYTGSLTTRNGI